MKKEKFNMVKMLLKKALVIENTEYLNFEFIFETQKARLTNDKNESLDSVSHSLLKDIFIKKLCKEYPAGKFISVKIYVDKIAGAVLRNDGSKQELNINF